MTKNEFEELKEIVMRDEWNPELEEKLEELFDTYENMSDALDFWEEEDLQSME